MPPKPEETILNKIARFTISQIKNNNLIYMGGRLETEEKKTRGKTWNECPAFQNVQHIRR